MLSGSLLGGHELPQPIDSLSFDIGLTMEMQRMQAKSLSATLESLNNVVGPRIAQGRGSLQCGTNHRRTVFAKCLKHYCTLRNNYRSGRTGPCGLTARSRRAWTPKLLIWRQLFQPSWCGQYFGSGAAHAPQRPACRRGSFQAAHRRRSGR